MNTVHLDPKSTGFLALTESFANSSIEIFNDLLNPSINEPHPDEQASFNNILFITPSLIIKAFISCPPISKIKSTLGINDFAPLKWQTVSISPISTPKAAFINSSPYPVTVVLAIVILLLRFLYKSFNISIVLFNGLPSLLS